MTGKHTTPIPDTPPIKYLKSYISTNTTIAPSDQLTPPVGFFLVPE